MPQTVSTKSLPVQPCRTQRQTDRIAQAFRKAPGRTLSNIAMSRIALRYSARIAELRKVGFGFAIIARNHANGLVIYRMTRDGRAALTGGK